ncbi:hypothetical protein WKG98_08200 [Pantoea agglomerans]|uniref:hypothetical protein n=1 Tax=Enterobacter agglomerans TaxID=549 RepID=UPI003C7D11DC
MSDYNFEAVNTDAPFNPEESAYAILAVVGVLAAAIADGDPAKKKDILAKLDKAYLFNDKNSCDVEIARMAKIIKVAMG